jgi:O-acetyl-ADP-ribose deacetylase (regulator of RNase III)
VITIRHFRGPVVQIELRQGSLLEANDLDIIVNAANCKMRGGGGLDGAVHAAAGPELLKKLKELVPYGSPTSHPVVTDGFETGFKKIIHTPGPVWDDGVSGERTALRATYDYALDAANTICKNNNCKSVGFGSISTGIFGFPLELAMPIALGTVSEWVRGNTENVYVDKIVFVMYGEEEYNKYKTAFDAIQAWNP